MNDGIDPYLSAIVLIVGSNVYNIGLFFSAAIVPLQSNAAANMLICNSVQDAKTVWTYRMASSSAEKYALAMNDAKNAEPAQNGVINHCGIICNNLLTANSTHEAITLSVHANTVPYLISATQT